MLKWADSAERGSADQQLIENVLHEPQRSPGGKKPQPLKSSWMYRDRIKPPVRETQYKLFIDVLSSGETICTADSIEHALELIERLKKQGIRAMVREEKFDEQRMQKEEADQRQRQRWSRGFGA